MQEGRTGGLPPSHSSGDHIHLQKSFMGGGGGGGGGGGKIIVWQNKGGEGRQELQLAPRLLS